MEELKKAWQKILIDLGKSETEVAKELGINQVNLNRKIRTGTIKAIELDELLQKIGYELSIRKKE